MKALIKYVIIPLGESILFQLILMIISNIFKDNFWDSLKGTPWYIWIGGLLLFYLLFLFNQSLNKNYPGMVYQRKSLNHVGWLDYLKIKWEVVGYLPNYLDPPHSDTIEVNLPPRCSKCGTELSEKYIIFHLFFWKCPNKDYRKLTFHSFKYHEELASKIARRKYETNELKKKLMT